MAIDTTKWAADLAAIVADLQSQITLLRTGQAVACTVSPVSKSDDVSDVGVLNLANCEAYTVASVWTSGEPNVRDVVSIDSVRYAVVSKETDSVGVRMFLRRV